MPVTVEFFGIPRLRTGVAEIEVEAEDLGSLLIRLAAEYPELASTCIAGDRLRPSFIANLNGDQFTNDPTTALASGDHVLLLSADAGG